MAGMAMRKLVFGALFTLLLVVALNLKLPSGIQPIMSLSVSSDGRYVVSAHRGKKLYLWNIEQQTRSKIAEEVNLYSAYFVRGSDVFIWQDLDNQVHVHSVAAGELFTFDYPEPTYGHLMTHDLQRYIASDIGWGIHVVELETGTTHTLKNADGRSFLGYGKVLNLSLSDDEKLLLMAGTSTGFPEAWKDRIRTLEQEAELNNYGWMDGVALWSLETLKPIAKLQGNSSKTHASISPDGQWVISGDENGIGRFWNTNEPEERFGVASYHHGLSRGLDEEGNFKPMDKSGLILPPPKISSLTLATGFIKDNRYYFHLTSTGASERDPYAVLFETGNPWPIQYFNLGTDPWPSTREYSRNLTVATAPEAGILVTGQDSKGGINVYRFDAEALTLERIWVGR